MEGFGDERPLEGHEDTDNAEQVIRTQGQTIKRQALMLSYYQSKMQAFQDFLKDTDQAMSALVDEVFNVSLTTKKYISKDQINREYRHICDSKTRGRYGLAKSKAALKENEIAPFKQHPVERRHGVASHFAWNRQQETQATEETETETKVNNVSQPAFDSSLLESEKPKEITRPTGARLLSPEEQTVLLARNEEQASAIHALTHQLEATQGKLSASRIAEKNLRDSLNKVVLQRLQKAGTHEVRQTCQHGGTFASAEGVEPLDLHPISVEISTSGKQNIRLSGEGKPTDLRFLPHLPPHSARAPRIASGCATRGLPRRTQQKVKHEEISAVEEALLRLMTEREHNSAEARKEGVAFRIVLSSFIRDIGDLLRESQRVYQSLSTAASRKKGALSQEPMPSGFSEDQMELIKICLTELGKRTPTFSTDAIVRHLIQIDPSWNEEIALLRNCWSSLTLFLQEHAARFQQQVAESRIDKT